MRISREQMYMEVARAFSHRSTCFRQNVGTVIVSIADWRINGTGYNGPPSGEPHCKGNECPVAEDGGCLKSIHAEVNALNRMELPTGPQWMFSTRSPCYQCAIIIGDSGAINRIYYDEEYRDVEPITLLLRAEIEVYRITPSGYIISTRTGVIVDGHT